MKPRAGGSWWVTLIVVFAVAWWCVVHFPYGSGVKKIHWKEQVALADGSALQVERYVKFHWQRSIGIGGASTGEGEKESTLRLVTDRELPTWSMPLIALLIDRDPANGEFVVVATTAFCGYWYEHGEPEPPYWTYRLHGIAWQPTEIPESFYGRAPNLFFDYNDGDSGDLTGEVGERKRMQIAFNTGEYMKSILRSQPQMFCTRSSRSSISSEKKP